MPIRTQSAKSLIDIKKVKGGKASELLALQKRVAKPAVPPKGKSHLESLMAQQIRMAGLPIPVEEYHFAAEYVGTGAGIRQRLKDAGLHDWRFDFCWPDVMLAVECDGGTWTGGRHTTGKGFEGDAEKANAAALQGWTLLRFTSGHIKSGYAIEMIKKYFQENKL